MRATRVPPDVSSTLVNQGRDLGHPSHWFSWICSSHIEVYSIHCIYDIDSLSFRIQQESPDSSTNPQFVIDLMRYDSLLLDCFIEFASAHFGLNFAEGYTIAISSCHWLGALALLNEMELAEANPARCSSDWINVSFKVGKQSEKKG